MFDTDRFIAECQAARAETDNHTAMREIIAREVSDHAAVMKGLGEPTKAGVFTLYRSDELTILNLVWGPQMTLMPHNHNMWAVIGMYSGREDNIFWRKVKGAPDGVIEAAGAKALSTGEAAPLGPDVIHSVTNPLCKLTGALHVYGGDFFGPGRSEWNPEDLTERDYNTERNIQAFEDSNRLMGVA